MTLAFDRAMRGKRGDEPEPGELQHAGEGAIGDAELLQRLSGLCSRQALDNLADRLGDLVEFVGADLRTFEAEFPAAVDDPHAVGRSAEHLLQLGGKRLRPLCVMLSSKLGGGPDARVVDLAVAVELIHCATLLHDDVVDHGEMRRGASTARAIYGNAASIFAGDWLLIEALRRVLRTELRDVFEDLLETIDLMIHAESLQLEQRGRLATGRDTYFSIVRGKTASLFRWAMVSGGAAGGLNASELEALAGYGIDVGIAFQAVDDLLDMTGDRRRTGKELFADLREGKMTYPLIVAMQRQPDLGALLEEILDPKISAERERILDLEMVQRVRATGALADCLALAREHSARAVSSLDELPASRARDSLETVAVAIVDREV